MCADVRTGGLLGISVGRRAAAADITGDARLWYGREALGARSCWVFLPADYVSRIPPSRCV